MLCKNIAVVSHDNAVKMTALLYFRTVTLYQFYIDVLAAGIYKNKALFQFEDPLHMKICSLGNKYRAQKICNFFVILFYMLMKRGLLL
jgi:hypothetical protein